MERKLSAIIISSIGGHSGGGMFPLTLLPAYREVMQLVRERFITSITKSATSYERKGNLILYKPWTWRYVQELEEDGLLNAVGLTNLGVVACAKKIRKAAIAGYNLIPSYYIEFNIPLERVVYRTLRAIEIYQMILGDYFWILELDLSCLNADEDIKNNMKAAIECIKKIRKEYPWLMLIAKISIVHPYEFAQELESIGVDILHAINTIPFNIVFPDPNVKSPLHKVGGGGVSGGPARKYSYSYNQVLRKKVKIPIIMGCGITKLEHAKMFKNIGANYLAICTTIRRTPEEAKKIILAYS
ncbi:MAG: hypothetical protein NTW06_04050 [Candidatus Falkowbacteria bacterium]|nr:hypothetical protein [Candidatus Falkowbacteria bacterium]